MSEPKRHHYIPRLILKRFVDANGHLHCCRRDGAEPEFFMASPEKVFMEKHLYTQDDDVGHPGTSVETHLSRIESDAAPVIDKYVRCALEWDCPRLSADEKAKLGLFWHYHQNRHPKYLDWIRNEIPRVLNKNPEAVFGETLTDEELEIIRSPENMKFYARNVPQSVAGFESRENLINFLKVCPVQFGVVRKPNKSFVIGNEMGMNYYISLHKALPTGDIKGKVIRGPLDHWTLLHPRVAFRFGAELKEALIPFETEHVRQINEHTVRESPMFAGRSCKLVCSLAKTIRS